MNWYFVGGIHGSGKSTFSRLWAGRLGGRSVSASELIGIADADGAGPSKEVRSVDRNQSLLLAGLERMPRDRPLVLDGHFALLQESGPVQPVPMAVFDSMGMNGFVLLDLPETEAVRRLMFRDGRGVSLDRLRALRQAEIDQAKVVAKGLNAPLSILDAAASPEELVEQAIAAFQPHR